MEPFVKLPRSLFNDEQLIRCGANTIAVYIYLLTKAQYKANRVQGENIILQEGDVLTSYQSIAKAVGLKDRQVARREVSKLERIGYISQESNNRYSVIHIKNWLGQEAKESTPSIDEPCPF